MPAGASAARRSASSCCSTDDPTECARIAAELDRLNSERRAIEVATVAQAEAEAMAALGIEEKGAAVVTAAEGWHPGVVGLVAARLKERFGRPAFAIALEPGGIGTGSGRSIAGVDLGRVVRQAVGEGLLIKGGGHAMAAGVTLRKDALAAFRAFLEDGARRCRRGRAARRCAPDRRRAHGRRRDRARPSRRSRRRARSAPAIRSRWWRCRRTRSPMPTRSVRRMCGCGCAPATAQASMRSRSARSARSSARRSPQNRGRTVHVAGCLALDRWQGEERVQLRILDVAAADSFPGADAPLNPRRP